MYLTEFLFWNITTFLFWHVTAFRLQLFKPTLHHLSHEVMFSFPFLLPRPPPPYYMLPRLYST